MIYIHHHPSRFIPFWGAHLVPTHSWPLETRCYLRSALLLKTSGAESDVWRFEEIRWCMMVNLTLLLMFKTVQTSLVEDKHTHNHTHTYIYIYLHTHIYIHNICIYKHIIYYIHNICICMNILEDDIDDINLHQPTAIWRGFFPGWFTAGTISRPGKASPNAKRWLSSKPTVIGTCGII